VAWRDDLLPASFRDVPFFVEASNRTGGRRLAIHEFPLRDGAFAEDLGRRGRIFAIEAFLIGPDYLPVLRRLENALEQEGPGRLSHPYHGVRIVAVPEFNSQHLKNEGGIVKVSITFVETPEAAPLPAIAASASTAVDGSVLESRTFNARRLITAVGVTSGVPARSLPSFAFNSPAQLIQDATHAVDRTLKPLVREQQALVSMQAHVDGLLHDAVALARSPTNLAARFGTFLVALRDWPLTPRLGVSAMLAAFSFSATSPRPTSSTPTRTRERANYDATDAFLRTELVLGAAQFVSDAAAASNRPTTITTAAIPGDVDEAFGFTSYDDALAVRTSVLEAIDAQLLTADDALYGALQQVRADVVAAVPGGDRDLPRLTTYTPITTVPAVVLAYRLYGSLALADDLVDRNHVRHPGFVIGGQALEVLSHG
jgi:prophage DNA circulation protein